MASERDLLAEIPPFDALSEADFDYAFKHMKAMYLSRESREEIVRSGKSLLYLVRTGTYDLVTPDGQVLARLEKDDLFGFPSLLSGRQASNRIEVVQDGIVWTWEAECFHALRQRSQSFEQYFLSAHGKRLLSEAHAQESVDWTMKPIQEVLQRAAVTIGPQSSIRAAAEEMVKERVSSLLIVEDEQLKGILTDRDLRTRVVAKGVDLNTHVTAVMTPSPASVYEYQSLFDALTVMGQFSVHHLPVLDSQDRVKSVITVTDLMQQQRSEPVLLINALSKAQSREQLVAEAQKIPEYLHTFGSRIKDNAALGRLLASVTDSLTRRLIQLFEQAHGSAPAAFAWLAFGSQARFDQTFGSDQDNGLLLANEVSESQREWFSELATFVCEGLAACGVPLCPGNVMAMNPKWRMTALEWQDTFRQWVRSPTPEAILNSMIFFDSRAIYGSQRLYQAHRQQVAQIGGSDVFMANIARHIATLPVPLGLFNRFRTKHDDSGEYLNVKTHGIAIVNDIVRLYSIAEKLTVASIPERLTELKGSQWLTTQDNQNLLEAWQYLVHLRIHSQLYRSHDRQPSNAIDPERLSTLQRRQLKAAFRVIKDAQQAVGLKFGRQL
ncbi:MAG: CBS domain-containing protein [Idiomarinaceae bacterium HL-53]|nr:MAG: CBS domain-containing protein [Idiomarinaceae bacterium HL-53]CUS47223.1 CBS domain-containing protein [Idiomarinaceae bacterium HL-53]